MSKRIENLNRRREKLGLSVFRYYHAFMHGYSEKGQKWKSSPYADLEEYEEVSEIEKLTTAYWEGRKTRYDYSALTKDDLSDKKSLTRVRT